MWDDVRAEIKKLAWQDYEEVDERDYDYFDITLAVTKGGNESWWKDRKMEFVKRVEKEERGAWLKKVSMCRSESRKNAVAEKEAVGLQGEKLQAERAVRRQALGSEKEGGTQVFLAGQRSDGLEAVGLQYGADRGQGHEVGSPASLRPAIRELVEGWRAPRVSKDWFIPKALRKAHSKQRLRIHTPSNPAGGINVEEILKSMPADVASNIRKVISDPEEYIKVVEEMKEKGIKPEVHENEFTEDEVQRILSAKIIERLPEGEIIELYCRMFTLNEEEKDRSRLIIEPKDLNKLMIFVKLLRTYLPKIQDIVELTIISGWLYQLDLSCFFYQIPLHPSVRKFFGVRINGQNYQLTCLPMGFAGSVYVAQHLASIINQRRNFDEVAHNYIDNIFGGAQGERKAEANLKASLRRAEKYGMEIKGSSVECTANMTVLGIEINVANNDRWIRLGRDFVRKHWNRFQAISSCASIVTSAREALRLVGILGRVVYVRRIFLFKVPELWDTMRELSGVPLNEIIELKIGEELAELARTAMKNEPVRMNAATQHKRSDLYIITDASLWGYGMIIGRGNRFYTNSGKWTTMINNMPLLEAKAFLLAVEVAELRGLSVKGATWYTDAACIIASFESGRARTPEVRSVLEVLHEKRITPIFVRSEKNPADGLSRTGTITAPDYEKLNNLCAPKPQY